MHFPTNNRGGWLVHDELSTSRIVVLLTEERRMSEDICWMKQTPAEVICEIFGFADGESLICCSRVCWQWCKLIKEREEVFFENICKRRWKLQFTYARTWKA